MPPEQHADLVRAFALYFSAVNLAERVHRIRRRRDYQRHGGGAQPGGLQDALQRLKDEGIGLDEVLALLPALRIEPVLTAHPTEAVRRALLDKEAVIAQALIADIDGTRTPAEARADREVIRTALTAGWQTESAAPEKPTVADESAQVGYYLGDPLYRVLPVFFEAFGPRSNPCTARCRNCRPCCASPPGWAATWMATPLSVPKPLRRPSTSSGSACYPPTSATSST